MYAVGRNSVEFVGFSNRFFGKFSVYFVGYFLGLAGFSGFFIDCGPIYSAVLMVDLLNFLLITCFQFWAKFISVKSKIKLMDLMMKY